VTAAAAVNTTAGTVFTLAPINNCLGTKSYS
jgi:hypothetical protein